MIRMHYGPITIDWTKAEYKRLSEVQSLRHDPPLTKKTPLVDQVLYWLGHGPKCMGTLRWRLLGRSTSQATVKTVLDSLERKGLVRSEVLLTGQASGQITYFKKETPNA